MTNDSATQDQIAGPSDALDTDWLPEFGDGPFRPLGGWTPDPDPCPICHRVHDDDDCGGAYLRSLRPPKPPPPPLPTGWSKLTEPTYAVSRDGEARRLPAGTYLAPLAPDERDGRLPALEVQMWTEPEWPYYERPVSFWFVEASALRFGEGA